MRISFAASLRFPVQCKSEQGQPAPKVRPKGVADGKRVNIRAPLVERYESRSDGIWKAYGRSEMPDAARGVAAGKSTATSPEATRAQLCWRSGRKGLQENLRDQCGRRPYQKPTQAGKESILRRSRELS